MTHPQDPWAIAQDWLTSFAAALAAHDAPAVAALFLSEGWLRDVLVFSWCSRSLEGPEKIAEYLSEHIHDVSVSEVQLSQDVHLRPAFFTAPGGAQGIEFAYTFETDVALGRGFARISQDASKDQMWKALTASTLMTDIKGHEEQPGRVMFTEEEGPVWYKKRMERRAAIESDPYVVIIGGGQMGLQVAARFGQMDIATLVIERNAHPGDHWRKRYNSLVLHTPREHHGFLYQQWPSTWPMYTPREKLAEALDAYAVSQDLVVWTSSQLSGRPTYNKGTSRWTLSVDHAGTKVILHPAHIVLATGGLGDPYMPTVPSRDLFPGTVIHSREYNDPAEFRGKTVVVIGAAATAIDICQDLALQEPGSVTMVQRSSTCVTSRAYVRNLLEGSWRPGVPSEIGDLKVASVPIGFVKKSLIKREKEVWEAQKELFGKLRKAGVQLNMGSEGAGHPILIAERGGGFWLDKGGADLLASGAIKLKSGAGPVAFTKTGLQLSDGSKLDADAVIFATGYMNIRDVNRKLIGPEIIDATGPVWGIDEEGELRGVFKPSGHPGLWYTGGDFHHARIYSKHLALYIKAMQLGLLKV